MNTNHIPRRCRQDQYVPAEMAIFNAMQAVEAMPADVRLTDAVSLLGKAKASVADFVDGVPRVEPAHPLAIEEVSGLLAEADHAEKTGANGGMVLLNPVFLRRVLQLLGGARPQ